MTPAIVVENLTYAYPGPVLANDNLSISIPRGEIFGLLGPNGAGKTTLVLQILGLLRPTSGTIMLEGVNVAQSAEQIRHLVGFLPQTGLPMRHVEVERALYFTGRLRGQTHHDARQQTKELIDTLFIHDYAKRFVNDLSGGMLRLVNFAMALMGRPRILVLDEPTNELDPQRRRQVWDMIAQLNRQQGVTCVLVTHNLLEAEQVVQRIAIMRQGRFVAQGIPGKLNLSANSRARLEFQIKTDVPLHVLSALDQFGTGDSLRPGHYRMMLKSDDVAAAADLVLNQIGLSALEDFHISPPSLEDIYLEYAEHSPAEVPGL